MNLSSFEKRLQKSSPENSMFENFGNGQTTIRRYGKGRMRYRRGISLFNVSIEDLFITYTHFKGQRVSTNDLRQFKPDVFDSSAGGRNCHCTVLFRLLLNAGLASEVQGSGVAGSPFSVEFYS